MTVKCTGAEFLRFYNDKDWWFSGDSIPMDDRTYWEDASIFVNGKMIPEYEFDFEADLKPTDQVAVSGGVVFGKVVGAKEPTVEGYLRRWLKAQSTATVVIECPKDKLDALLAAVKMAGGRIPN
jgi:hypothetical protein